MEGCNKSAEFNVIEPPTAHIAGYEFSVQHVIVNNAASLPVPKPVLSPDLDIQDWWATFSTNILGTLHCVRAFVNHAAGEACLANISTAVSHIPQLEAGVAGYSASKAAARKLLDYIDFENPG